MGKIMAEHGQDLDSISIDTKVTAVLVNRNRWKHGQVRFVEMHNKIFVVPKIDP